jgi:hypothetical protein
METCQRSFKVLFHIKGYIRLEVPLLRKLSWAYLYDNFNNSSRFPLPSGVKNFYLNPLTGSMVITYEPDMNIIEYVKNMATDIEKYY